MMYLFIWFSIKGRRVRLMSGAPLIKSMSFQLRLNCSARSHRLRWSPGDSTELHNAIQLAYIIYGMERHDFRQFWAVYSRYCPRRRLTEVWTMRSCGEISVAAKARTS